MNNPQTFTVNATTYIDNVGFLPPNFPINYEVTAHFPDRSPATAALTIRTADAHPVTNVRARLEENGRKVVVTWADAAKNRFPDYLYLAAVNGGSLSQTIPAGARRLELTGLPPGTHTYAILGYYNLAGFGVVESNHNTAPQFTVRIPHCVLLYRRALSETDLEPRGGSPEALLLSAGESRKFNMNWAYAQEGTDSERFGSHLREAKNDGTRDIELSVYSLIMGGASISVIKPGETKTYMHDLARVTCLR